MPTRPKDNVLIDTDANAKIADFGRAHVIDEIEVSKALCATASWTAPEGMDPPDEKILLTEMSDMWSLGITILEVCCHSYNRTTTRSLICAHAQLFDGVESLWGMRRKIQTKLVLMIAAPGKKPEERHYPQTRSIEGLWNCLYPCWNRDTEPIERVTAEELEVNLAQITV